MVLWAVGAMEGFNQEQHHQLHVRLERKVIMPLLTSPSHSLGAELGSPGHLCLILGSGGASPPSPLCARGNAMGHQDRRMCLSGNQLGPQGS